MSKEIIYIDYDEVLNIYGKMIYTIQPLPTN